MNCLLLLNDQVTCSCYCGLRKRSLLSRLTSLAFPFIFEMLISLRVFDSTELGLFSRNPSDYYSHPCYIYLFINPRTAEKATLLIYSPYLAYFEWKFLE